MRHHLRLRFGPLSRGLGEDAALREEHARVEHRDADRVDEDHGHGVDADLFIRVVLARDRIVLLKPPLIGVLDMVTFEEAQDLRARRNEHEEGDGQHRCEVRACRLAERAASKAAAEERSHNEKHECGDDRPQGLNVEACDEVKVVEAFDVERRDQVKVKDLERRHGLLEHLGKLNAEVERHRADDLVKRDQNAKLSPRDDVDNHPPEARASALDVFSVAILTEAFGERTLEYLRVVVIACQ